METETINGVRREVYITNIVRKVEFWIDDDEICSVTQKFNVDNIDFLVAPVARINNVRLNTAEMFNLYIEALRQAADVFAGWAKDEGKEISEK